MVLDCRSPRFDLERFGSTPLSIPRGGPGVGGGSVKRLFKQA